MLIHNFDPVAFNFFTIEIRWYSLAYIFGIICGWIYAKKVIKNLTSTNNNFQFLKIHIIDEIIQEPVGGAHRNKKQVISSIKTVLIKYLEEFKKYTGEEIFEQRKKKFLSIGKEKTFTVFSRGTDWIRKDNFLKPVKEILFKFKKELVIAALLIFIAVLFLF